jgi:hypothetical protein
VLRARPDRLLSSAHTEQAARVEGEDGGLVGIAERGLSDLVEQVADAATDGIGVQVGAEDDPVGAEADGELLGSRTPRCQGRVSATSWR